MRKYLNCTVSYPVMNLSLNLYQDAEDRKTKAFLKYETHQRKLLTLHTMRQEPYQPVFAPYHRIKPADVVEADA